MSSQDFLISRSYAAEEKMRRIVDDGAIVYRIKEVSGGTSAPTVVVSNTSTTLTLTDRSAAATAIDLAAADYNTVGEVVDYINGLANWECKLLDGLRSDASDNKVVDGAVTAAVVDGESVFDVKEDTSARAALRLRIAYDMGVANNKPKGSHRIVLKKFIYNADLTAAANAVKVYEYNKANNTETVVFSALSVDITNTTVDFNDGITAGEGGNEFVIEIGGTVVDAAANYLQAQYKRE